MSPRKRREAGRTPVIYIKNRAEYDALSNADREDLQLAYDVINEMNRGLSLTAAAAKVGTTPAKVQRYASDSLVRVNGRYQTKPDRSYRRMSVLSVDGVVDVDTRGSRVRSTIGSHWNAVRQFGATGDVALLEPFEGARVGGVVLATNPDLVEEYLRQGGLDIDDIYV